MKHSQGLLLKAALGFPCRSMGAGDEGVALERHLSVLTALISLLGSPFWRFIWTFPTQTWSSGLKGTIQGYLLPPSSLLFCGQNAALGFSTGGFLIKPKKCQGFIAHSSSLTDFYAGCKARLLHALSERQCVWEHTCTSLPFLFRSVCNSGHCSHITCVLMMSPTVLILSTRTHICYYS